MLRLQRGQPSKAPGDQERLPANGDLDTGNTTLLLCVCVLKSSPEDMFIDFRERGRKRDRKTLM